VLNQFYLLLYLFASGIYLAPDKKSKQNAFREFKLARLSVILQYSGNRLAIFLSFSNDVAKRLNRAPEIRTNEHLHITKLTPNCSPAVQSALNRVLSTTLSHFKYGVVE
jgi:hypothetical protein